IDATTETLYVIAKTKERVAGIDHYVQGLHALNLSDGKDRVTPFLIGDTIRKFTFRDPASTISFVNNTQIFVYGNGYTFSYYNPPHTFVVATEAVTDPYHHTGKLVVQFNALHEAQRGALSLVKNTLYAQWAGHDDRDPYHGWVVAWDVSNLQTSGIRLKGVFNTSPNGGEGGIWQGGGRLAFEADGSSSYFEVGNGPKSHSNPVLDSQGFPVDGNYYDALVKLVTDSTTTSRSQNK